MVSASRTENGGYIQPTKKKFGHSPCPTLHATMPRQKRFTREEVLQQLFSQQPSSEPEPDQEADGQGDREADGEADREKDREADREEDRLEDRQEYGEADRKADRGEETDDDGDYEGYEDYEDDDYDPVGNSADSSSCGEEEGQDHGITTTTTTGLGERATFLSRNREIVWSSRAYFREEGRLSSSSSAAAQSTVPPGPTMYAMSRAVDQASTFHLFITPTVENIILKMTNWEGRRKYGDEWRGMDETDLRAYIGLLILAGVYRSQGGAASSLRDAESRQAIFRATMPLKLFHTYSRLLRFDDRETRRRRRATDKLAAVQELWDEWVAQLPSLYNPGPEVTVDEQLVPFRG